MRDTDWDVIRLEYVTTKTSCSKLADKYGLSLDSVKKQVAHGGWVKQREEYRAKVARKATQKIATSAANTCAKAIRTVATSAAETTKVIAKIVADGEQFQRHIVQTRDGDLWDAECRKFPKYDMKALVEYTKAMQQCVSVLRDVYGLPGVEKQAALDLAERRMALDEKRADAEGSAGLDGVDVVFEDADAEEYSG